MLKVEHLEAFNIHGALRGMRNPLNSWDKSDSLWCPDSEHFIDCHSTAEHCPRDEGDNFSAAVFCVGRNDLKLAQKLRIAGDEHRKFMRQIFVCLDITAPLYWWKEFDTYKVGTVANSCSTMHTIAAKEFTLDDFSHEHLIGLYMLCNPLASLEYIIDTLNEARGNFIQTKDKKYWYAMIQLLPSSYNQKRTVTMSYENVVKIVKQRSGHKLDEWHTLIDELMKLPYMKELVDACAEND